MYHFIVNITNLILRVFGTFLELHLLPHHPWFLFVFVFFFSLIQNNLITFLKFLLFALITRMVLNHKELKQLILVTLNLARDMNRIEHFNTNCINDGMVGCC